MVEPTQNHAGGQPARPHVTVDGPFGDRLVYAHNELELTGRVASPDGVQEVYVELDGMRFDAATAAGDSPGGVTFDIVIPAPDGDERAYGVRLVATSPVSTTAVTGEVEFNPYELSGLTDADNDERLAAGRPIMWVEWPWLDGTHPAAAPVMVSGWACAREGLRTVTVFLDGVAKARATHGFPSPHMRSRLGELSDGAGFALELDRDQCGPGTHTLTVVADGADGTAVGYAGVFTCEPPAPDGGGDETAKREGLSDERYVPELHTGMTLEPEHQARYAWVAPLATGRRVLDAACGTGFGSVHLLGHAPQSLAAFDRSPVAVQDARRRLGDRATVVEGDMTAIPFPDDSFDLIICFEAIEHVVDPAAVVAEFRRILAPGGVLAVSTPNRGVYARGNPHHLHEFSSSEFETFMAQRFANTRIWRQETRTASTITGDDLFEASDPAVSITVDTRQVTGGTVGGELYMVALAADGELPELGPMVVLGRALDFGRLSEERDMWRSRALLTGHDLAHVHTALLTADQTAQDSRRQARLAEQVACTPPVGLMHAQRQRDELATRLTWARSQHDRAVAERDEALLRLETIRASRLWRLIELLRRARGALRPG